MLITPVTFTLVAVCFLYVEALEATVYTVSFGGIMVQLAFLLFPTYSARNINSGQPNVP